MKKAAAGVVALLLLAGCSNNRPPAQNISPARHPNLAAAQRACGDAYDRIVQAQQANEWDLGGHAQKAKDLLVQAADELKQAALAANRRN
jgi:hypothetical protein